MKRIVTLSLFAAVALAGCTKPKPVVMVDSWWNLDMAKKSCQSAKDWLAGNQALVAQLGCDKVKYCPQATSRAQACAADPAGGVREFEAQLADRFAKNSGCAGVELLLVKDPNERHPEIGEAGSRWQMMLTYEPGSKGQVWSLSGPSSEYVRGGGGADDIASSVCAIVSGVRTT